MRCSAGTLVMLCGLVLAGLLAAGCGGGGGWSWFQSPAEGDVGYDRIALLPGGYGQHLVPVQIGNQTFRLLLDSGFNGLLVFADKVTAENTEVQATDDYAAVVFGSGTRSGRAATAPIKVGNRAAAAMRILLVDDPTSSTDPSLSGKQADGIFGLRFQPGTAEEIGVELDVPLLALDPKVRSMELDLNANGASTLVLGGTPTLDRYEPGGLFAAQTTTELGANRIQESYADLEVPFSVTSSAGTADDPDLDILLDTGATSLLILDAGVASVLGYDAASSTWLIPEDEELDLKLVGLSGELALQPRFRAKDVRVLNLSGNTFDAVLGLDRWRGYVVGFEFIDFSLGGPEGTFRFLARDQMGSLPAASTAFDSHFVSLPGLNSSSEDGAPSISADGTCLAFESDRPAGRGLRDIYLYRIGQGLVDVRGMNSESNDEDPAVSADGNLVVFTSDRPGGEGDFDIYLADIPTQTFLALPGLNTASVERSPYLSADGRFISFRSERDGGDTPSDVYLYDRETGSVMYLPDLNGPNDDFTSALSADGQRMIIGAMFRDGDEGWLDVHVYDVANWQEMPISTDVNTANWEAFVGISGDGRYIGFFSDRNNPTAGAAGRDIFVYDLGQNGSDGLPGAAVSLPGLNTSFEDSNVALNQDGSLIAFASSRAGGVGGRDVYLYRR